MVALLALFPMWQHPHLRQAVHGDTSARISDFQRAPRSVALAWHVQNSADERQGPDFHRLHSLSLRSLSLQQPARRRPCRCTASAESRHAWSPGWSPDGGFVSAQLLWYGLHSVHQVLHDLGHGHTDPVPSVRCVPSMKHLGADPAPPPTSEVGTGRPLSCTATQENVQLFEPDVIPSWLKPPWLTHNDLSRNGYGLLSLSHTHSLSLLLSPSPSPFPSPTLSLTLSLTHVSSMRVQITSAPSKNSAQHLLSLSLSVPH